ncbi:DUF3150 domain-containing protein [Pseudomonas aeruginosa]
MQSAQSRNVVILNNLRMVGLTVNIWSARKKLRPEDLGAGLQLPPSELASLGSKRIIDPDCLKPFETLKRRAVRVLAERGVRFMGAYLVPEAQAAEVAAELEAIEREFLTEKKAFLGEYDKRCNEWINRPWEKPAWREAIRRAITPLSTVDSRIGYRFSLCCVKADQSQDLNKGLEREVDGLSGQLFREIAEDAETIADDTLAGASSVTQKTVNRIRKMHKKLVSLAFLSPEVQKLADHLEAELNKLPSKGKLEGSNFNHLLSLVMSLTDEDRIAKVANVFAGAASVVEVEDSDLQGTEQVELAVAAAPAAVDVSPVNVLVEPMAQLDVEAHADMVEAEIAAEVAQPSTPACAPEAPPVVVQPVERVVDQGAQIDFCL